MTTSPNRSASKRFSRRISNFVTNSISLFNNNENQGILNIVMGGAYIFNKITLNVVFNLKKEKNLY